MAKPKNTHYVVWKGRKTGIFDSWSECKEQVEGFNGAQYKGFPSLSEAETALKRSFSDYRTAAKPKPASKRNVGKPNLHSIAVDAACSGKTKLMEFQGVDTRTGETLFHRGPYDEGTNNIGEFLALVLGLAFLQKNNQPNMPIYSDSKTAISWVKKKKCNTKMDPSPKNRVLFNAIRNAEHWLKTNKYTNPILKWETEVWGEIPADFGRK